MIFDPTRFSAAENEFLKAHIHEAPVVALKALPVPGVNPRAVKPVLDAVQEFRQLSAADKSFNWKGEQTILDAIDTWNTQNAKWLRDTKRGAPRYPSKYSFTTKGRPLWSGPGSDSKLIKTYFRPDGSRAEFAVSLVEGNSATWVPEWVDQAIAAPQNEAPKPVNMAVIVNSEKSRIECGICGHTESFNPDSRTSYNSARGRISRHLRKGLPPAAEHLELHSQEFRS